MPSPSRLAGRFFSVLISIAFAIVLPRNAVAGEAVLRSPAASPLAIASALPLTAARFLSAWPSERRYTLAALALPARLHAFDGAGPTLCQITDTVYRADGTPAQGDLVILWPAFTTAAGQPVAAGQVAVQLGPNGQFNASLAPNAGATPVGTYYRVTYKLNDGTTNSEYWTVPNTPTTTIGAIRSTLVPATQAAQFLTRQFADANYLNLTTNQTVAGIKTFSSSPAVPAPQNPSDSANKAYVDANAGSGNLAAPPPIGNVTPNTVNATVSTAQDSRTSNLPVFDLRAHGLVGDAVQIGDGGGVGSGCLNMNAGSAIVTITQSHCPWVRFAPGDVGKAFYVFGAGTVGGNNYLNSTIASWQSATQVTLANAATHTQTATIGFYGTDNTAAWCAAMQCTTAASPDVEWNGINTGRIVKLPRGTYLVSGPIYSRRGDILQGDDETISAVIDMDNTNNASVLKACSSTSGVDVGGQTCSVKGIWWATPENGSITCINDNGADINFIARNWFQCGIGIQISNGGTQIYDNTFDGTDITGIILNGNGNSGDANPVGVEKISHNLFYAQAYGAIVLNGVNSTDIVDNLFVGNKFFDILVNTPGGHNYTSYKVNISNNQFQTSSSYYDPSEVNISIGTGAGIAASQISHNTFSAARNQAIAINTPTVAGLAIESNTFFANQGTAIGDLQTAGTGLSITNNKFYSPGNYAVDLAVPAFVAGNYCTNPFAIAGLPANDYDKACFHFAASTAANLVAKDNATDSTTVAAVAIRGGAVPAYSSGNRSAWSTADVYVFSGVGPIASSNERIYNGTGTNSVFTTMSDPSTGNASFGGDLSARDIPGHEYFVNKYSSIQAAITAAYNNGAVLGEVIDDRTSPYTGPGFILYDSVTLKLAPTTYTINATVTYNNGNNNVTAGIVALPGARLLGSSTSTNHGTIVTAANGLNADLIATSTVGTGIAAAAQWWHWGGFENLRVTGNGANQTAGNCFNIENMGETAFLRTIEVSGCYLDNILFTGASATPSDIANITTNSAGRYGFNFNNLSGVAVVHGLSGDSNTTSIVRLNGGQSGTLTILGFKTEEEISGQDPLITIDQTGQSGAQPGLFIIGGYTFGRTGVSDFIKYVNGTSGTTPFISVSNFYVQNYVNAVNDTVNSRTTAAANMNKVPFYYGPTGAFFSGQAYTLDLNTFVQSPHSGNGILTEIFGTTSSNETLVAASGTSSSIGVGGIGFRMPNRTTYGQSPELFAKMTYAFPGGISNPQQWEFIPTKAVGDSSTRWIGDPSYRWDEVYAADVNTTTATVGTLNVGNCVGCGTGTRLVSGTMQGATATLIGNSSDQTLYTAALPAGTFAVGAGVHCYAKWTHPTASGSVTYKWTIGTTTWAYGSYTSSSQNIASDVEILTIASLSSQSVNLSPVIAGTAIGIGGSYGNSGSENLANADTIKLTFNAGSSDQIKGATFYCQTVQ